MAGSSAATAPRRVPRPTYAARWAASWMVVTTEPPALRSRVMSFHSGRKESSGSLPSRTESSACSRNVVPYTCEAKPVTGAYNGPSR